MSIWEKSIKSIFSLIFCWLYAPTAMTQQLPSEYGNVVGSGMGLSNSGVAAFAGIEGIQLNPALIAIQKQYRVTGGFYWPEEGRDYYQAGVVDSTTASFAAAASYTNFTQDFDNDSYFNSTRLA